MSELTKEYGEKFVDRLKRCLDHMDENNEIEIIMDREGLEECIAALTLRSRDAGDEEIVRLAEEYQLGETELHRMQTYKKLEGVVESLRQQLREAQAEIERLKQQYEVDGKVISRLGREKMRLVQLFRFWVKEYSRFTPEEVLLRGVEPRMDDVQEIIGWLEE